ncbi:FMN-dependent dehydrogenase-domain-containing protein [Xylaria acuta]|nr:FMN-dependent dehydrogenase-domain-containing protein [Xylaria acuta]
MGDDGKDVTPPFGHYQTEIYTRGVLQGLRPTVTTDPNKLRLQAKEAMREDAYNYIAGGAGEGATMDANRLAFRQWKIVPRMMRPSAPRDLRVSLFGELYGTWHRPWNAGRNPTDGDNDRTDASKKDSPVLIAPVGAQEVYHRDKEIGTAAACAELNVPFVMSTASTSSMQEVAAASGDHPRWFQLYWPMDDEITASILSTAKASGFKVLVVTVDTATMSWRPADLDTACE